MKGVYQVNAVDCVTQGEIVATCERLSETLPPAADQGHARGLPLHDQWVARRQRLGVRQPSGRRPTGQPPHRAHQVSPAQWSDNGLAETKNGTVVRKCFATTTSRYATNQCLMRPHTSTPTSTFQRPLPVRRQGSKIKRYNTTLCESNATPAKAGGRRSHPPC